MLKEECEEVVEQCVGRAGQGGEGDDGDTCRFVSS